MQLFDPQASGGLIADPVANRRTVKRDQPSTMLGPTRSLQGQ